MNGETPAVMRVQHLVKSALKPLLLRDVERPRRIKAGTAPREIQRQIDRWYDEDTQEPPFNPRPRRPQRPRPLTVAAEQPR